MTHFPSDVWTKILQMRRELHLPELWRKQHRRDLQRVMWELAEMSSAEFVTDDGRQRDRLGRMPVLPLSCWQTPDCHYYTLSSMLLLEIRRQADIAWQNRGFYQG